jgi:hypothetical protein
LVPEDFAYFKTSFLTGINVKQGRFLAIALFQTLGIKRDFINTVVFEVLTAVVMNVATFSDITPCSPYVNQCFGGTCHFHFQG